MSLESLDEVLKPGPPANAEFQRLVLESTRREVVRRARRRPVMWLATVAMVAALVWGIVLRLQSSAPAWEDAFREDEVHLGWRPAEGKGEENPAPPVAKEKAPEVPKTETLAALDLEWRAFDEKVSEARSKLLVVAGRKYLEEQNDYSSALRRIAKALDKAKADALAFSPEDDWLLMALQE